MKIDFAYVRKKLTRIFLFSLGAFIGVCFGVALIPAFGENSALTIILFVVGLAVLGVFLSNFDVQH